MKKRFLKSIAAVSAAAFMLSAANYTESVFSPSVSVYADDIDEEYSPVPVSSDIVWSLDENGVLRIDTAEYDNSFRMDGRGSWDKYADKVKYAIIGEGITEITEGMFFYCCNLKSIYISSGVIDIDESFQSTPFDNCTSLENITVAANNPKYADIDGVLFNKDKNCIVVYPQGSKRKYYTLPEGTLKIYAYAFGGVKALESITLPESLKYIAKNAFSFSSVKSVNIPPEVEVIDEYAFYHCSSLETVKLSCGLKRIEEYAFCQCRSLGRIEFPDTLEYLGKSSFSETVLTEVYLPDSVQSAGSAFSYCKNLKKLRFSAGMKEIYSTASYCYNLEDVDIPEGVEEISRYAFEGCEKLRRVTVPSTVKKIDLYAFRGCKSLKRLELPKDIEISEYAFSGCPDLKIVYIDYDKKQAQ